MHGASAAQFTGDGCQARVTWFRGACIVAAAISPTSYLHENLKRMLDGSAELLETGGDGGPPHRVQRADVELTGLDDGAVDSIRAPHPSIADPQRRQPSGDALDSGSPVA
jgi:hypothetical protein